MANNKKANGAWKVSKVLCETMLEEWYEYRVYRGKKLMATFTDPNEAGAFVKKHMTGEIIATDPNDDGRVVVAKGYRTAGATLTGKIYYKCCRRWMLEVEEKIRKGKSVAIEDLVCMLGVANSRMLTEQQKELKAAVWEYANNGGRKAA